MSVLSDASGYAHAAYAASLRDYGTPRYLPCCDGWVLERPIDRSGMRDAMGCYPLFSCTNWRGLPHAIESLAIDLVSVVAVIDPLADVTPDELELAFPDLIRPLKDHFIVDLCQRADAFVDAHHRRNARKALRNVAVESSTNPHEWVTDWINLYGTLIQRHDVTGISAFSKQSLARQLEVPGCVAVRARTGDATLAMLVWYVQGEAAYYHLGASSAEGYAVGASFALFWESISLFAQRGLKLLELGGGAGVEAQADDGLSRFKRGWSTGTRTAYLCGRILDPAAYERLGGGTILTRRAYFPAYRAGEFR